MNDLSQPQQNNIPSQQSTTTPSSVQQPVQLNPVQQAVNIGQSQSGQKIADDVSSGYQPNQNKQTDNVFGSQVPMQQPAVQPISIPHREHILPTSSQSETSALITPSEQEPQIPKEIEHIVEKVENQPVLTEEHKKIGLELAKEATLAVTQPIGIVQLPMTEEEALKVIKLHTKISNSILWLAKLVLKQIKISRQKTVN